MRHLIFKFIVVALIAISLTACGNTRMMSNIKYVGIDNEILTFLKDDGQKILFYGDEMYVEHLIRGQKYTVEYYFDNQVEDDYYVSRIILNEDLDTDKYNDK